MLGHAGPGAGRRGGATPHGRPGTALLSEVSADALSVQPLPTPSVLHSTAPPRFWNLPQLSPCPS